MSEKQLMERKSIILRKSLSQIILRDNQDALREHDEFLMKKLIKESCEINYKLNGQS